MFNTYLLCMFFQISGANANDLTRSYSLTYDKAGVPDKYKMMGGESYGASSNGVDTIPGNVNGMVCGSETDSTNGACPTKLALSNLNYTYTYPYGFGTPIRLKLTSSQTGATKEVIFYGVQVNACTYHRMADVRTCASDNPLKLILDSGADQLSALPAGTWKGTMLLYQRNSTTSTNNLGTWRIGVNVQVNDSRNQQIYFPAFSSATPRVNLKLMNRPGTQNNSSASGKTTLDMCLYDGSNSSSARISLLFQDESGGPTGRASNVFSVYREGADKMQEANRLDYNVSVINPTTGAVQEVRNNTEIIWTDTNRRNIQRQVVLPGVPGVSLCVPAPITLTTPAFRLADKTAGHYTGLLRIIYTPTTQTSSP